MARASAYNDFLRDPDQTARRAELAAFIGPNAEPFMRVYDALQARAVTPKGQKSPIKLRSSFVALGFFLGPCWFFYRRMWAWGWGVLAVLLLIGFLPGTSRIGVPFGIAIAVAGRQLYIGWAVKRIVKLRTGDLLTDLEPITRAGGVSKPAGWISSVILGLLGVLGIASLIYLASQGQPLPR